MITKVSNYIQNYLRGLKSMTSDPIINKVDEEFSLQLYKTNQKLCN